LLNINLIQNIQITQSHYVKLALGYVKNSTQKFEQGSFLTNISTKCLFLQNFYCVQYTHSV